MELAIKKNLIITIIASIFITTVFVLPVLASETDGTIDSSYKHAWGENIGWINFGSSEGNVHITDSSLSGYAWGENVGWINLNPDYGGITNDGQGNLSGYAWGENVGWISFNPSGGGVSIDSNGDFSGYAWGENVGWIIFNCSTTNSCATVDYKIKTDWRPQSVRDATAPTCSSGAPSGNLEAGTTSTTISLTTNETATCKYSNNKDLVYSAIPNTFGTTGTTSHSQLVAGLTNDTSYVYYIKCQDGSGNSNTDDYSISFSVLAESGGGLPVVAYSSPTSPESTIENPEGGFRVLVNENDDYTNKKEVNLKLFAGDNTERMAISNTPDFSAGSTGQIAFQSSYDWNLCYKEKECLDGTKTVYVKFYTQYGQVSEIISDTILLDATAPKMEKINIKDYYNSNESIVLSGTTESQAKIILHWDGKYGLVYANDSGFWIANLGKMSIGLHSLELKAEDNAENISQPFEVDLIVETSTVSPETELPEIIPDEPDEIIEIPEEIVNVPEKAPLVMQGQWQLLPSKSIKEFVLAPLPNEINELVKKFPELEETFKKVGIGKITDVDKLKTVELTLPGLTEKLGLLSNNNQFVVKGIPVAKLPQRAKQAIPNGIIFAKTGNQFIDLNAVLSITEQGKPEQKINTISGKPLQLVLKPDKPVKSIKGYLVFKSKKQELVTKDKGLSLNSLLASVASVLSPPVNKDDNIEIEERLLLLEFEYTDPDGDGIYTAEIQAPVVEGEYEIIAIIDFKDPELGKQQIRLITVIDPEGYIYEKRGNKEMRIPEALVSLFWLNPKTDEYELWPAKEYQQENPQTTNTTGKYSFLVPQGFYYIKVEAPDYLVYNGELFEVKQGKGIHSNIELKTKYGWLKIIDWKFVSLILIILFLLYIVYRVKIKKLTKPQFK